MKKNSVYQMITDRIIELLEQGTVPWRIPWSGGGPARNLVSKRPYRGINRFLLNVAGYASPYWLTFIQTKGLGGSVIKGEKATPVVFWKLLENEDQETGEIKHVPVLRYYQVFNLEQTKGIEATEPGAIKENPFTPIERCERIVAEMPDPPRIEHKRQAAFYNAALDLVNLPKPESFVSSEEYYATLFHECIHASGAEHRLNRASLVEMTRFGDPTYAREELIAEMGASMLCGEAGIENATIENSAAYVQGWLRKLRKDNRMVVIAAAQAEKAVSRICVSNSPSINV